MADRRSWMGSASDLLRACADRAGDDVPRRSAGWPRNPRALAGRLRRMQTFLRTFGIEIAFSREGRTGTRTIHISAALDTPLRNTVSTVNSGWDETRPIQSGNPQEDEPFFVDCADDADDADAGITKDEDCIG
jgi:hypothetical protein